MSNAHLFCTHLKNYKTKTGDDFFCSTACIPFDVYIYIYIYIYIDNVIQSFQNLCLFHVRYIMISIQMSSSTKRSIQKVLDFDLKIIKNNNGTFGYLCSCCC